MEEIKLIIARAHYSQTQTIGFAAVNNGAKDIFTFTTLELPWKNNERRVSCIPPGVYRCVKRVTPKYGHHWHILDVPDRDLILMHHGNFNTDILGCVLSGKSHTDLNNDGCVDVTDSIATMKKLRTILPDEFQLEIIA